MHLIAIVFTFECLMYLYHYPYIWFNYATWHTKSSSIDSGIKVYQRSLKCLNDGTPNVGDVFSVLAAIAKSDGMRPLQKLDDVKRNKLSEMIGVSRGGAQTVACSALLSSSETLEITFHSILLHASDGGYARRSNMLSRKNPITAAGKFQYYSNRL